MQIPSLTSELQTKLIQQTKPQAPKPQTPAQVQAHADADGDQDGDTLASDKGHAVDTKA